MKALRKLERGPGNVAVVEVPDPVPGEGQVLINVKRAGICGTDLHIYHGLFPKVRPPVTLGHEISGSIVEVGPGVSAWSPGDPVTVESEAFTCGKCRFCISGFTNLCPDRLALGYGVDGGFAPYLVIRQTALHRLPAGISYSEGSLCEPLAVAVHAVMERIDLDNGSWSLITGPGPIGLLVLQVVRLAGGHVIIVGTRKDHLRLQIANDLGADSVIQVDCTDLREQVETLTEGRGVSTSFECSGSAKALNDCVSCTARRGAIVQVGLFGKRVQADFDGIVINEISLKGTFTHNHRTWIKAIELLAQKAINLRILISGEFAITEWEKAFRFSEEGVGIKYLLCPEQES